MSSILDPLTLPSVLLSERQHLPSCAAIYFAIDANDRILYVGKAKNLAARWKNHHRIHKLKEIDQESSVRLAWQAWNEEDLDEAERSSIKRFQPLLNNTEVETPAVIPSEVILRDFLKTFSRRLIVLGIKPKTSNQLLNIHLKYDWTDCSPKGTAARIKDFIKQNKDKNTSLKFKRHTYSKFDSFAGEVFRPGSRDQRKMARKHRSYNNHWECACNGVIIHITPTDFYRKYKEQTQLVKVAGISLRAITKAVFIDAQKNYELSGLSCFTDDPVPLLWLNL
ncbi:GIY-YIG nuclease family protein [Limnoraphis robusta Tam1]|uniref:GIY-YIG nuclease family protein n=1 Tax=Limnoraphis robusta TaxID=1118279 RepID=UPI002B20F0C5|nr:GIY-YIG nuclease family protein [Limnoraphis robusta]MEA5496352.1 GIY-YIG nuclease family protein [Limnoraphis robusta BA-68 BA1]MEA5538266.1 GIY-YIG nuclease family protein [Limnoraphis robusta Tam1]